MDLAGALEPANEPKDVPDDASAGSRLGRRGALPAGLVESLALSAAGVVVEWYDFAIYLYLAPVLSRLFFAGSTSSTTQLVAALGVFATGYLARPLGALFYGALGDRVGRKQALIASSVLMALCKLLEGILPTYAVAGLVAPLLLTLMRVASGFSMGGEYAGSFVYLAENAPPRHRGFICSLANAMCALGIFLAALVVALVQLLPAAALDSWGWRLPFFIGAGAGLLSMRMRTHMQESPLFERLLADGRVPRHPVSEALRTAPRKVAAAFALASYIAITYHVLIAFVPTYLKEVAGLDGRLALAIGTGASLLNLMFITVPAELSDRIGRKRVLMGAAVLAALGAWPVFSLLARGGTSWAVLGAVLAVPLAAAINATAAALAVESFPTRIRFSGFAVGFNLGSIMGGFAPAAALYLVQATGLRAAPAMLVIAVSVLAMLLIPCLEETSGTDLA